MKSMKLFRWAMVATGTGLIYFAGAIAVVESQAAAEKNKKEASK